MTNTTRNHDRHQADGIGHGDGVVVISRDHVVADDVAEEKPVRVRGRAGRTPGRRTWTRMTLALTRSTGWDQTGRRALGLSRADLTLAIPTPDSI